MYQSTKELVFSCSFLLQYVYNSYAQIQIFIEQSLINIFADSNNAPTNSDEEYFFHNLT